MLVWEGIHREGEISSSRFMVPSMCQKCMDMVQVTSLIK